jgi:predicted nucleic acid-binding protein
MARIVVLDSGPLGLLSRRPNKPIVVQCHTWLLTLELAGATVINPEVADYEVRRKLLRARFTSSLKRLDDLKSNFGYLPITTGAMLRAADYWADTRRAGVPTASPQSLDADCIVAGQAATVGGLTDAVVIATSNTFHLGYFTGVNAQDWMTIS